MSTKSFEIFIQMQDNAYMHIVLYRTMNWTEQLVDTPIQICEAMRQQSNNYNNNNNNNQTMESVRNSAMVKGRAKQYTILWRSIRIASEVLIRKRMEKLITTWDKCEYFYVRFGLKRAKGRKKKNEKKTQNKLKRKLDPWNLNASTGDKGGQFKCVWPSGRKGKSSLGIRLKIS